VIDFYKDIKDGLHYNKFECNGIICIEYTCPIPKDKFDLWFRSDLIVHVLSGKKTWRTFDHENTAAAGETMYIKKGGSHVRQYFFEDFCMLGFFVSDDFIRRTISEFREKLSIIKNKSDTSFQVTKITNSPALTGCFQSLLHYFKEKQPPNESLLSLKCKELILGIISNSDNQYLTNYLLEVSKLQAPGLSEVMEKNFCFNLSLADFADLSNRSLSTFKRDFQRIYKQSPGKWLLEKRLQHAAGLLFTDKLNIGQVAYECGFEDISHFSRTFRQKFGETPLNYRKQVISH